VMATIKKIPEVQGCDQTQTEELLPNAGTKVVISANFFRKSSGGPRASVAAIVRLD
jgi:hypothetical protein